MKTIFRRLWDMVAILVVLAGVMVPAMPRTTSAKPQMVMTLNYEIHKMDAATNSSEHPPCDASKELCCREVPNLPPGPVLAKLVTYIAVIYWHSLSRLTGLSHRPALFPPINI